MSILNKLLPLPFLNTGDLGKNEKKLALQVCGCVAWADGEISDSEKKAIRQHMAKIGGYHATEIDEVLSYAVRLDTDLNRQLQELYPPKAHLLLKLVFLISNADNNISDSELAVIKSLSSIIMPNKEWSAVRKWIESYKSFIDSSRSLFEAD